MQVITSSENVPGGLESRRTAVTIGVFDGIHLAHQALITRAASEAQSGGLAAMVITFQCHPLQLLAPPYCPKKLIYPDRKRQMLAALGMDLMLDLAFTQELAQYSPERFVEEVLVRHCRARTVVCGYDFSFGNRGAGDVELLRRMGAQHGYETIVVDALSEGDCLVKSTHVRELLFAGNVARAAELLTRPYELRGNVVTGYRRGRQIGFPTANLEWDLAYAAPGRGVYVAYVREHGENLLWPAMVNIGVNPTFGLERLSMEAHLLNFDGDLVGRLLEVHFVQRLRDEQKFSSVEALVQQLHRDRAHTEQLLNDSTVVSLRKLIR